MLSIDLLLLTLPYLNTNDCARLACVNKHLFHTMNNQQCLRIIFRYHRIVSLSLNELRRGLRYIIAHPSVTYFNKNGQRVLNKFQIVRGWYSVDIFGRLHRKRRCLDCNIVQLEELPKPVGSCVTLDDSGVLKIRIRGNPQPYIIRGVAWFTISNKYYILYRDLKDDLRVTSSSHEIGELVNPSPVTRNQIQSCSIEGSSSSRYINGAYVNQGISLTWLLTYSGDLYLDKELLDHDVRTIIFPGVTYRDYSCYYLKQDKLYCHLGLYHRYDPASLLCEDVREIEQFGALGQGVKVIYHNGTYDLIDGAMSVEKSRLYYNGVIGRFAPGHIEQVQLSKVAMVITY